MDFGALPPEVNSARMYAGPGPGSMLAAAAAWNALAAELHSVAATYTSVISELTSGPWQGPSSMAMAAAAAPYAAWMSTTAGQAELAATQAQAAAGAYEAAFAMSVPPPMIAANRAQLTSLVATNVFGQNTPAIAATEAQYGDMWAQDAAAMYGYAANSAAITAKVTPITPAPQTTNLAGLAAQGAAGTQAAGTSTGAGVQSTLSQLVSTVPTALQNLASPSSAALSTTASSTSGLPGFLGGSSASGTNFLDSTAQSLVSSYLNLPGLFGMFMAANAIGPLMNPVEFLPFLNMGAAAAAPIGGVAALPSALGSGFAGGLGGLPGLAGLAGIGQAASVGGLSVPATWGWAATAPPGLLGSAPLGMLGPAAAGADVGAGLGFPFMFPGVAGLGRGAAAAGVGAVAGAAAAKYLPRLSVVSRSPAAGYPTAESVVASTPKYPAPAGFPINGDAPPGYQPAVIYVPTNGQAKAEV